MRYEPEGFIFRYWDYTHTGMNGWSKTKKDCIEKAFFYGNVYECQSYQEAFDIIQKHISKFPKETPR